MYSLAQFGNLHYFTDHNYAVGAFSYSCLRKEKIILLVVFSISMCFHLLKTALFCFLDNWNCLALCSGSRDVNEHKKFQESFSHKNAVDLKYHLQKKKKKDSKRIREMGDFLNKEIIILLIKKYQTTI